MIQIAEFAGVYGVSALVIFANVALYNAARAIVTGRLREKSREMTIAAVSIIAVVAFGVSRMRQLQSAPPAEKIRVAMIQGNIPQNLKWDPDSAPANFKTYEDATRTAAREHPDLIVWPETAHSYLFQADGVYPRSLEIQHDYHDRLLDLAGTVKAPILFGAEAVLVQSNPSVRNRAYLLSDHGQMMDYYDKMLLVPFAEYLPVPALTRHFWRVLVQRPFDLDFEGGNRQTIFKVGDARITVLICFESIWS